MSQDVQNVAKLYRLQWSNGKARKDRYFSDYDTSREVYNIIADALPSEDWCRLSEMSEDGLSGFVESRTILYTED